jgi:kynurenine formamidase
MDRRVQFDFEVDFTNGGGIQGQGFRLDLDAAEIDDRTLAEHIVQDLRLLMVGEVRILNKQIIIERHKRASSPTAPPAGEPAQRFIDLSHAVIDGMITYQGLPAPLICDFMSREASQRHYAEGTTFHIGKIEMVANTGTYLDSPFHRFEDGQDLSELDLRKLAELDAVVVRVTGAAGRAVDRLAIAAVEVRGKAVLVQTGWDRHWGTEQYFDGHPFLTAAAAEYLRDSGAVLVGIDALNIDDIADLRRPVHTALLRAGIPIVEHLCHLDRLPISGFTFTAVPVKVKGMGTFPVRAYGTLPG